MKKMMFLQMTAALLVAATTACSSDDPMDDFYNQLPSTPDDGPTTGNTSSTSGDLTTFTVSIDKTTAEPATSAAEQFPDSEDMLENNSFTTQVNIVFNGSSATYDTVDGVAITTDGAHVTANHGSTKSICYVVSGSTTSGSLTIVGDKKYEVQLNGADITNPDSAALNLLSKKRAYIVLADGTTNKLTDGTTSKATDQKAAFFCKGKLLFNGSGALEVYGNYNNAIHCSDYIVFRKGNNVYAKSTANHGIKANDGLYINGGILNVEVSAAAAKGINCESHVIVNGGRTTVITTGNGTYDTDDKEAKGAAGIKADSTFTINGGELYLKSTGSGGKGINVDMDATFNGGSIYIITEGSQYSSNGDTASPKGIKVDGNIYITNGLIWVRTNGKNGEGIESKSQLSISGGQTAVYAYDDAINSKSHMTISGGYVYAHGRNNDGLDANGNLYIKGGTVIAVCSGSPEVAIDANTEGGYKLYVTGGNIVAIGGLENGSSLTQACYQASWTRNTWYAMTVGSQTLAFKTPASGGSGLVISAASKPALTSGVSISGGTSLFGGLASWSPTVSGGSTVTISSYTGGNTGRPGTGPGGW